MFAKPSKRTTVLEDNTTTHAAELEKRKKSALCDCIPDL
jgi:hypothetical protein